MSGNSGMTERADVGIGRQSDGEERIAWGSEEWQRG